MRSRPDLSSQALSASGCSVLRKTGSASGTQWAYSPQTCATTSILFALSAIALRIASARSRSRSLKWWRSVRPFGSQVISPPRTTPRFARHRYMLSFGRIAGALVLTKALQMRIKPLRAESGADARLDAIAARLMPDEP
jgi:hypothetical protein